MSGVSKPTLGSRSTTPREREDYDRLSLEELQFWDQYFNKITGAHLQSEIRYWCSPIGGDNMFLYAYAKEIAKERGISIE